MVMYKHVFQLENQKLKITKNLICFAYIYVSNRSIVPFCYQKQVRVFPRNNKMGER